jgi:hypothetical protein
MMKRWRRFIQHLNPYLALTLLAVPLVIVEPLKLIAIFIVGTGHWITGSAVMLFAYAGSLLVVERLFKIVKPKLLTLSWFAALWKSFTSARKKMHEFWLSRSRKNANKSGRESQSTYARRDNPTAKSVHLWRQSQRRLQREM